MTRVIDGASSFALAKTIANDAVLRCRPDFKIGILGALAWYHTETSVIENRVAEMANMTGPNTSVSRAASVTTALSNGFHIHRME